MRAVHLLTSVALGACALPEGRGELEATVEAASVAPTEWTDADGRVIALERGEITLQDLYLHEPAATHVASFHPLDLLIPSAYAHPGHDDAGSVAGEMLGRWRVDLAAGVQPLGTAALYEGAFASATLGLASEVAFLEGTVTDEAGTRPFAFSLVPDQELTGLPFEARFEASDTPTLRIEIDPAWILSFVDLGAPDTDGDGLLTGGDGDNEALLRFGVHSTGGYAVALAGAERGRAADIVALPRDPERGEAIYARDCAGCHGANGEGAAGPALAEHLEQHTEEAIVERILEGARGMPAFGELADADIADLLGFLYASFSQRG